MRQTPLSGHKLRAASFLCHLQEGWDPVMPAQSPDRRPPNRGLRRPATADTEEFDPELFPVRRIRRFDHPVVMGTIDQRADRQDHGQDDRLASEPLHLLGQGAAPLPRPREPR